MTEPPIGPIGPISPIGPSEESSGAAPGSAARGFRRAGRRALLPAERRIVRGRARWLWAKFAGAVLAFWLALFVALGTGVFIEETEGSARLALVLVTLLLFGG